MKISLLSFLLLLCSCVMAQEPDSSSELFGMREAERNFARESVMYGRNAAFANNFAEESVIFTDKWITNGKQYSKERKASPVVLKWEPEFMDIADSRDFGVSTGPWEVQEYRPNTAPLFTGYFLTVWQKQPDGIWKVILDGGSGTPVTKNSGHNFAFPSGADKPVPKPSILNVGQLKKDLLERESQFQTSWKEKNTASTYLSFCAHEARLQLAGHLPSNNSDTIKVWINQQDNGTVWQAVGAGAATSGDLGYTYGLMKTLQYPEKTNGHYVRIWKRRPGESWKIIIEMLNINK